MICLLFSFIDSTIEWREPYKCGGCKKQGNNRKCQKVCRQQCYYRDEIVEDSYCSGNLPTKYEDCPATECLGLR